MTKPHEYYMSQALELAQEAADAGEVPVGCVIVRDGAVIGRGRNRREEKQAVCSHAEMEAMAQANAALGSWRLDGCALYVTLEPCPMCAGAIINSRIRRVVYGAADTKAGCCGSVTEPVLQGPSTTTRGGAGAARRGSTGAAAGVFQGSAGTACGRPKWKPPV